MQTFLIVEFQARFEVIEPRKCEGCRYHNLLWLLPPTPVLVSLPPSQKDGMGGGRGA